jgi:hypothetical protein
MLVEADAGFLGNAGGIGIQGAEKILNLLPNLRPNEGNRPTAWNNDLPWLDRVMHFPLYPTYPQRNVSCASEEAAARTVSYASLMLSV